MAAVVCAAVGWTSYKITRTTDDVRVLTQQADAIRKDADGMKRERDAALTEAEEAKIARAQIAGHLEAVVQQKSKPDNRPTTRPATFIQKLASTIFEQ